MVLDLIDLRSLLMLNMFVCLICNSISIVLAHENNNLFLRGTLSSHIDFRTWFRIGVISNVVYFHNVLW